MKTTAFMQWQGTDICVDIHCKCDHNSHFDGYSFNYFKCKCGRKYEVSRELNMTELKDPHVILATSFKEGME